MADQTLARRINERRVLSLLRDHGALTRAEIARQLSLTRATIGHVADDLIQRGMLAEDPRVSDKRRGREMGRPGIDLRLAPDGGYYLGIEIGVGIIRFALLDMTVNLVEQSAVECDPSIAPDDALDLVQAYYEDLVSRERYAGRIRAIGITVPGLVRSDGFVVHLPILGWKGVNLLGLAEPRFPVPLQIDNNANAAAFGEVYTRPGMQRDAVIYLKIGMGCGGAVVIDGRLLRGAAGTAAELGHLRIATDGPLCGCGRRGCLEPSVNLHALQSAFDPGKDYPPARLRALPGQVASLSLSGEARAQAAVDRIAAALEQGVVSLINIFDPRTVVLGGVMRPIIERCLPRLRAYVADAVVPGMLVPDIRLSHLGDIECAVGAAALVHHEALDISQMGLVLPH